ncbi:MAG: hypothetical protein N2109_01495 [Fimbriimonadales bacterium]|nr:hypothetical protein [Fimbriimonadales bacterium]
MPTYVYECSSCSKVFEVEQRITEDPLTTCACGGEGTVKRLIQPTAVLFKGPGFHINDYASKPSHADKSAACPAANGNGETCANCPSAE